MAQYANRTGIFVASATDDPEAFKTLNATIDKVNGRASRHTYNATQIVSCTEDVEDKFDAAGFTERERIGTIVNVVSGGPRAASYNGSFVATFAKLVRRTDGWHLIEADTDHRHAGKGAGDRMGILITKSTAEAVQKRVLAEFIVREPKRPTIVSEAA